MKKERGGYERRGFDAVYLPPEVERNPAARNRRLNLFGGKTARGPDRRKNAARRAR